MAHETHTYPDPREPSTVVTTDESAYIDLMDDASAAEIRWVHELLAERGMEMMDPSECPGEPIPGGFRYWAALKDGGR